MFAYIERFSKKKNFVNSKLVKRNNQFFIKRKEIFNLKKLEILELVSASSYLFDIWDKDNLFFPEKNKIFLINDDLFLFLFSCYTAIYRLFSYNRRVKTLVFIIIIITVVLMLLL